MNIQGAKTSALTLLIVQLIALAVVLASHQAYSQVTFERLLNSAKEPQNWLTYSGDYSGQRHSGLDQINATNVSSVVSKWVLQTAATGKLETSPLVADGILYATAQDDRAFALDARSGRPIWFYQRQLPADIRPCCGRVNRGLAILGDKVYLGTLDAHLIALDAKTGIPLWKYTSGERYFSSPAVVNGMLYVATVDWEGHIYAFHLPEQ